MSEQTLHFDNAREASDLTALPKETHLEVERVFGDRLDLILDGGACPGGKPSTLVDLCGQTPRVLREGRVSLSALRPFLPELE